jgi:hypothetical protein
MKSTGKKIGGRWVQAHPTPPRAPPPFNDVGKKYRTATAWRQLPGTFPNTAEIALAGHRSIFSVY